jgi:hypothetical protein
MPKITTEIFAGTAERQGVLKKHRGNAEKSMTQGFAQNADSNEPNRRLTAELILRAEQSPALILRSKRYFQPSLILERMFYNVS